jgi:hypothetical protein
MFEPGFGGLMDLVETGYLDGIKNASLREALDDSFIVLLLIYR